jgi:hypothetical protein
MLSVQLFYCYAEHHYAECRGVAGDTYIWGSLLNDLQTGQHYKTLL